MNTTTKRKLNLGLSLGTVVSSIITKEGEFLEIYECKDSGKVINREKKATLTNVIHPGIIIGQDKYGRMWVAHNHISNKKPTFDLFVDFSDTVEANWDFRKVYFTQKEIVQRAINEVLKGNSYNLVNYNCQTFVNRVVRDENSSEAIDKLSNGAIFLGLFTALIGVATKNKALIGTGIGIAAGAGIAKGYSKLR